MEEEKKGRIEFSIKKKKPKPNAPEYRIKTMEEFFAVANKENYKRLMKDFKSMVEICVHFKEISKESAKNLNKPDSVRFIEFTWIDD